MNITYLFAAIAIIFVLSYDTKSGTIEKFMGMRQQGQAKTCCNQPGYMANNPQQCQQAHFEGVQFADGNYGCPATPDQRGGVLYGGAL